MKNFTSKKLMALLCMLMMVSAANAADIVISKVFYAGTTKKGLTTNYTGGEEYIELHNNTAKEINIAGYCIALIESEGSTGAYLASAATKNEVKLKQVYQIPDDKEYIVAPWGNVVIAACAKDHSADAENGPDLSKADFSFGSMAGDNENVTKLNLLFSFNANTKAVNLTNGGDAGVLLIKKVNVSKLTYVDEATWVYGNGKTSGSRYLPFNASYADDAVEILKTSLTEGVYTIDAARKRLMDSFDKGYVPADQKMNKDGYIAYRKTALNADGNIYLYDTQNSCVDFQVSKTIGVGEYDKTPAGTTPVKVTIPESGYLPFKAEKYFFTEKGLYVTYVNPDKTNKILKFIDTDGSTKVFNNSPYILVGAPGEYTVYYTDADRNMASAGNNAWIADGDTKYADGVLTITTTSRYPMKFVNEKGNVRFVRDMANGNPQTLNINIETEGRFYANLNYLNEEETTIAWAGITPEEITGVEDGIVNVSTASNAVYSIQGVKMTGKTLAPGVYVKNGKAFVVK